MERPIEKLRQLQEAADKKHNELMFECDMLQGNINRMMVANDHEELLTMFAYAHHRLDNIYWQNKKRINLKNIQEQTDGDND
jgi:hypothetical protein